MLQLLAMKVPDVLTFDFMSKPSPGMWAPQHRGSDEYATAHLLLLRQYFEELIQESPMLT